MTYTAEQAYDELIIRPQVAQSNRLYWQQRRAGETLVEWVIRLMDTLEQ